MANQDKTTDAATTETGAPTALRASSEATAANGSTTAEVLDVTADCVAWTETRILRLLSDPCVRMAKRKAVSSDMEKTKKSKKKPVRDDVSPTIHAEISSVAEVQGPSTQESAAATLVGKPVSMASTPPRRSKGFDLTEFISSFNPGRSTVSSPAAWQTARSHTGANCPRRVAASPPRARSPERPSRRGVPVVGVRTEPNDQGELPSGTIVELSCASFPKPAKKAQGKCGHRREERLKG
ncbi:LOW QUALITY PROTEIN: hypothetical protein PHMEG_00020208 [Phytophthora megakarya]|uniref:Uncharacterized protein n=1 Tax=Phytophthora megakarya TaxID=4795 RepID=A0A225VPI6_9STRA|nr:LOW QUALITY PROTEIN: hypothetical protein PHMEG_00020208 [Phytophthora megakarya]